MDGQSWRELASCWQYCARHGHIKPTACHSEGRGRQPIAIRRRPEQNTEHMVTQVHPTRLTHRRRMCSPPHATPGAGRACCRRLAARRGGRAPPDMGMFRELALPPGAACSTRGWLRLAGMRCSGAPLPPAPSVPADPASPLAYIEVSNPTFSKPCATPRPQCQQACVSQHIRRAHTKGGSWCRART